MGSSKVLLGLFIVALGIDTWSALSQKYVPYPAFYVRTAIGFGVITLVSMASMELASALALGYIVVDLVKHLKTGTNGKTTLSFGDYATEITALYQGLAAGQATAVANRALTFGQGQGGNTGASSPTVGPGQGGTATIGNPITIPSKGVKTNNGGGTATI